jgi:hypothetical protein
MRSFSVAVLFALLALPAISADAQTCSPGSGDPLGALIGALDAATDRAFESLTDDLNHNLFDGSPFTVTNAEARSAHQTLMSLSGSGFSAILYRLSTEEDGLYLNRYLENLAEADSSGEKLGQFLQKLARSNVPQRTIRKFLQAADTEGWSELMAAYSKRSVASRRRIAQAIGSDSISAKTVLELLQARMDGLTGPAQKMGLGIRALGMVAPLPSPIKQFIGLYGRALGAVPAGFAGAILKGARSRHTTAGDYFFIGAAQDAGYDTNEALELLQVLKRIYQ